MPKIGIVLVNIGTPKSPEVKDVSQYLSEFLMDPLVINLPFLLRWILVKLIIVPFRSVRSAEKYKKVWTKEGSPLLIHSQALAQKIQSFLPFPIEIAMHYGDPSIPEVLKKFEQNKVEKLFVVPMYPQYAEATTESCKHHLLASATDLQKSQITFMPPFFCEDAFLGAWVDIYKREIKSEAPEHTLFTFHGLPMNQIKSVCPPCDVARDCCAQLTDLNANCYRVQCFETARLLAERLSLKEQNWSVSFQSRLGRAEWIRPYTEDILRDLAQRGVKKIAVLCPAFTADCLETLEEIGIEGRHTFLSNGGKEMQLLPCLNSDANWAKGLANLIQKNLQE